MSGGYDGKVYLWELNNQKGVGGASLAPQLKASITPSPSMTSKSTFGFEILAIASNESKKEIYFAGNEGVIYVYSIFNEKTRQIQPEFIQVLEVNSWSLPIT